MIKNTLILDVLDKYKKYEGWDFFIRACQTTMSPMQPKYLGRFIRTITVNHGIQDFNFGTLKKLQAHCNNIAFDKLKHQEYEGYFMSMTLVMRLRAITNELEFMHNQ